MAYIHDSRNESSVDLLVEDKMEILKEFCVVYDRNYSRIESKLRKAIADNPNRDPEIVVEQIVNSMIMNSYND